MEYEKIFNRALKRYNKLQLEVFCNDHLVIGNGVREECAEEHAKWNLADLIDAIAYEVIHIDDMIYDDMCDSKEEIREMKQSQRRALRFIKTYEKYLGDMKPVYCDPFTGGFSWYKPGNFLAAR